MRLILPQTGAKSRRSTRRDSMCDDAWQKMDTVLAGVR